MHKKLINFGLLILATITLVISWSFASAPGGSPDEPAHLVSIYCFNDKYSKSCQSVSANNYDLSSVKNVSACYLYQRDRGVSCEITNIFETLTFNQTELFSPFGEYRYYKYLSIFSTDSYIISLLSMRIFNGTLLAIFILLSYLAFPLKLRSTFLLSTIIVLIPLGLYIATSINTSAWLVIGTIGFWSSAYAIFHDIKFRENGVAKNIFLISLALVSFHIATSSRFDGIYIILISLSSIFLIFVVQLITNQLNRIFAEKLSRFLVLISLLFITSFAFYLFRAKANIAFVDSQFNIYDRLFQNFEDLPHLLLGPFGSWGLGWLDIWLSPITYISMYLAVFGVVFFTIRSLSFEQLVSVLFLSGSVILLPIFVLQSSGYLVGEWVQPRYILPLYFPLFGLLMLSATVKRSYLNQVQLTLLVTLVALAHSFALHSNIERYVRGQNTYSINLTVNQEWWWDNFVSPNLIWLIGSASFLIILSTVAKKYHSDIKKVGPEGLEPPTPAL